MFCNVLIFLLCVSFDVWTSLSELVISRRNVIYPFASLQLSYEDHQIVLGVRFVFPECSLDRESHHKANIYILAKNVRPWKNLRYNNVR